MGWRQPWRLCLESAVFQILIFCFATGQVCSIEVWSSSSELQVVKGSAVTLGCRFRSSEHVTSLMSVDWSYRPQTGGRLDSFFYFSSRAHAPEQGQFKGRIRWVGKPNGGDASIQLLNATLNDNGTYTCITLSVVPKPLTRRFSDVAVLMGLVLLPSALIIPVLLGRMCWQGPSCCGRRGKSAGQGHPSPIEVTEREELMYKNSGTKEKEKEKSITCCELYFQDSDVEEYYVHNEKFGEEAETHC
ncbi:hypothetical protein AGOR_G00121940 [Albula goreensis]|uniref:Ig-like domain-containing protein n=1 Tax=Albula goreensis TaxID=1534307 RepID=A0A8T3DAH9_9TELE|nr:hypothetical protein AGOR_G00121940 [Albula goreensis]